MLLPAWFSISPASNAVTATGILLDVFGAVLLAVPDIPWWSRFARVKAVAYRVIPGALSLQCSKTLLADEGHLELGMVASRLAPDTDSFAIAQQDLSRAYRVLVRRRALIYPYDPPPGGTEQSLLMSRSDEVERIDAAINSADDPPREGEIEADFGDLRPTVANLYSDLERRIPLWFDEATDSLFRQWGLGLIVLGFALQFVAALALIFF